MSPLLGRFGTVDRRAIELGQARRGAVAQVLPVRVEQQDRAEDAGARGRLDDPDQLAQRLFERAVANRQLEHPVVRLADGFVALVAGDLMARHEHAGRLAFGARHRLEDDIDENLLGPLAGPSDLHRHLAGDEGLAGESGGVEQLGEFLARQFGQALRERRSGQVAVADEIDERRVDHGEAVIPALDQGHESRSLLEHLPEPRALATSRQPRFSTSCPCCSGRAANRAWSSSRRRYCSATSPIRTSGMQTFLGISDPVFDVFADGLVRVRHWPAQSR